MSFLRFSLNFARNKDLPAGFNYYLSFYFLYMSLYTFQSSSFCLYNQKVQIVFDCSIETGEIRTQNL